MCQRAISDHYRLISGHETGSDSVIPARLARLVPKGSSLLHAFLNNPMSVTKML